MTKSVRMRGNNTTHTHATNPWENALSQQQQGNMTAGINQQMGDAKAALIKKPPMKGATAGGVLDSAGARGMTNKERIIKKGT